MVEIISKHDGPRREDAQIKRVLEQNRGVITKLADHLSNGSYSQSKKPRLAPQPDGLIIHIGDSGMPPKAPELEPRIRVSTNGRVICVDTPSGRQLQHFGDIREGRGVKVFTLATTENHFIAPLDEATTEALFDLDGVVVGASYSEEELAADIGRRLDIPSGM